MPAQVERIQSFGINKVFLAFVSVAILGGLALGYSANVSLENFFRGLVLANIFLAGYLVLVRNLVGGVVIYLYALVLFNYYWRVLLPGLMPDIDLPRLMFTFAWVIFIVEVLLKRRELLPGGAVGILMMLVLIALFASMLTLGKRGVRVLLNGYLIPYAMFALTKNVFTDRRSIERFVFWLAVPLALYFPAMSIFEHYKMYSLLFPSYIGKVVMTGGDVGINWGGRAMGTFIQPAVTGAAMVMIFFLAVYALARIKSIYARLYSWLLFIVTPVGVFFTYTRSVYLGFSLGLLLLTVFSRRLRLAAALLLIGMGLVVLGNWSNVKTAERESGGVADMTTAQGRVVLMNASLRMFMDHPFVGVGFQRFMEKSVPYIVKVKRTFIGYREGWIGLDSNQHNQFFSVLTELGLLGFIPFALMYVFLFRTLARARSAKVQEYDSEFVVAVWAAMAAYLSALMFIEPRYFEFLNTLPFMLMGIVVGGYERAMLMQRNAGRETAGLARKEYAA